MKEIIDRLRTALGGRYELERELGSGGMATVWLARDMRHERRVALKVLRPDVASTLGGERFLREIRLAAGLQHPHIVPLYDSGEAAGLLYYVMPHLEGESLRQRLQRDAQMPVAEALLLTREVADALQYAHQQDLVHRDIKPDNILLVNGHAMVLDFGIARAVSAASGLTLTETGIAVGTPAYMSPEQGAADPRVDARSDIYALGCVLYEMLAGTPPFTGPTAQAVMSRHSVDPVPSIRTLRPTVSLVLEATLTKALAKLPADRHATAAEFARSLIDASTTTAVPATNARVQRPRVTLAVGAAALAAVLVAGWFMVRDGMAEARSLDLVSIAVLPMRNLGDSADTFFAAGLARDVTSELARVNGLAPRPFETVSQESLLEPDPVKLGERLGVQYVLSSSFQKQGDRIKVRAELLRLPGGSVVWADKTYDGNASDLFSMQESIARQLVAQLQGKLVAEGLPLGSGQGRRDPVAYRLFQEGRRWAFTLTGAERRAELLEAAVARDSTFAQAWGELSSVYDGLAQFSGRAPPEIIKRALNAAETAVALDSSNGLGRQLLAHYRLYFDFDIEGFHREMTRALVANPGEAGLHLTYGQQLRSHGLADSALAVMERALVLDPTNAFVLANVASIYAQLGQPERAERELHRAVQMDSTVWLPYMVLAELAESRGDDLGASRWIERSHAAMSEEVPWLLAYVAYFLGRADRREEAQKIVDRLTEIGRKQYVQPVFLATAKLGLGDRAGALDALEASLRARDRDFFWKVSGGEFEELRGEPRYEEILKETRLDRYLRRPGNVASIPLHRDYRVYPGGKASRGPA